MKTKTAFLRLRRVLNLLVVLSILLAFLLPGVQVKTLKKDFGRQLIRTRFQWEGV